MRLDGGSMWGVVPKNLWGSLTPAAEDNTILLALRPFLVERGDVKAVIEVGIGDRWEDKWKSIYHIERETTLESSVRACGLELEDIDAPEPPPGPGARRVGVSRPSISCVPSSSDLTDRRASCWPCWRSR